MQSRPKLKPGRPKRAQAELPGSQFHRLWTFVVQRKVVAAMLLTAGVLCVLAPRRGLPKVVTADWWTGASFVPESVRAVAAIVAAAVVLLAAIFWQSNQRKQLAKTSMVGAGLVVAGLVIVVFSWFTLHLSLPAGQMALGVNQTAEFYEVPSRQANKLRVMLPMRTTLRSVRTGDVGRGEKPVARVELSKPGDEAGTTYALVPGQILDVDNVRLAFVGLASGADTLRAVVTSRKAGEVPASGGVIGDELRFAENGPRFEVVDVTANYLDTLGPAVQLFSEDLGEFWVYQKAGESEMNMPEFGHDLELREVQAVPKALLSAVRPRPIWPTGLGAVLFVVGWVVLRRFRVPDDLGVLRNESENVSNKEGK